MFLGEDWVQTREYSDETARIIDEEIERILREAEDRTRQLLHDNRKALEMIARALLERETIDGREVNRLIDVSRRPARQAAHAPAATGARRSRPTGLS